MRPSRRTVLGAAGGTGVAAVAPRARAASPEFGASWLQATLERYAGFGIKASGGAGDQATGAWLENELRRAGYVCERQPFEVPFFEPRRATLSSGAAHAEVIPQAIVAATGPAGVTGPLRLSDRAEDLTGAIALVVLPYKRWVAIADPRVAQPLADAFRRGALAAVLVTTGPTGDAVALNVSMTRPGFDRPVAILAPKDAAPFVGAAHEGRPATLVVDGQGGGPARRTAFNVVARLDRKAENTLILSTPRSGWFTCAAERGSGLAVWLALAHWLARADPGVNLELLATSGHEYEYIGGELYLEHLAPKPARTRMWVHIGASVAARDWLELGPRLLPLPSADSQRVLIATPDVLARVKRAFAGITGLEATFPAQGGFVAGELVNPVKAGYATMIGEYGGHRYFHTRDDDLRCVSGDLVAPVAAAYRRAIVACLAEP